MKCAHCKNVVQCTSWNALNCKNVVTEKWKKKCQLGIFWVNKLNKLIRIIPTWTSYLPFGNCYLPLFKIIIINSCMEMRRLLMNPPSRCGLLIPIWLLSSFFIFLRVDNVIAIWCVLKEIEKEREKERKKDWWNSKRQNLQRSIYFRYFTDLETRFLEMMMVERYLGA